MPYKDPEKRNEYHKAYYKSGPGGYFQKRKANNPQKRREEMLAWKLKAFGMMLDDYWAALKAQDGRCAICGEYETVQRKSKYEPSGKLTFMMAVDHDHQTGKFRALLCRACNAGLGNFADNLERLEAAIAYLRQHKQTL